MAQQYCDDNDKSTEFMLQYMQDVANVDLDCVIKFLKEDASCKKTSPVLAGKNSKPEKN